VPGRLRINPKSEYRNPKQTLKQMNLKSGKSKTPNPKEACLEFDLFWSFEFVSNFGFRASNFLARFCIIARDTIFLTSYFIQNFKYAWLESN